MQQPFRISVSHRGFNLVEILVYGWLEKDSNFLSKIAVFNNFANNRNKQKANFITRWEFASKPSERPTHS